MQDEWWQRKAKQVERYADMHATREFFSTIKSVYGPSKSGYFPWLSSDGSSLMKDQEGLKNHWAEHFSNLLNRPSTAEHDVLQQIPQLPVLDVLDLPPSPDEIKKAILQMNSNKATG